MNDLYTSLTYLKGVGPYKAGLMSSELGIRTFGDLIEYFPFRYIDRSVVYQPNEVSPGPAEIQVRGVLSEIKLLGHGPKKRLTAKLNSDNGSIELIWFKGVKWIQKSINPGNEVIAFGRISDFNGKFSMSHPDLESINSFKKNSLPA